MAGQEKPKAKSGRAQQSPFVTGRSVPSVPILFVSSAQALESRKDVTAAQKSWARTLGFQGDAGKFVALPDTSGGLSAVAFGIGDAGARDPMMRPEVLLGGLAPQLPMGTYHLGDSGVTNFASTKPVKARCLQQAIRPVSSFPTGPSRLIA
jgi:hypothetical protein